MADIPPGAERVSSNDVYVNHRGLIYLIDRNRGLSILERLGATLFAWEYPLRGTISLDQAAAFQNR